MDDTNEFLLDTCTYLDLAAGYFGSRESCLLRYPCSFILINTSFLSNVNVPLRF